MNAKDHPEFQIEEEHLNKTLGALEAKLAHIAQSDQPGGDAHAHNALVDLAMAKYSIYSVCHCEERSLRRSNLQFGVGDCFAPLAMTSG